MPAALRGAQALQRLTDPPRSRDPSKEQGRNIGVPTNIGINGGLFVSANHFVYKLIPPRPTFPQDASDAETAIMERHFSYWRGLFDQGNVVVYGPVADPSGTWGLAVVEADTEQEVRAIGAADPAVRSREFSFEVYAIANALVR
jgi:uncharacterized protein